MKRREEVINEIKKLAGRLKEIWSEITVIITGSYAREDFNQWSDVDVLIVVRKCDENPLRRYDRISPYLKDIQCAVEPIIITVSEFLKRKKKKDPLIIEAMNRGVVITDELGLLIRREID